MTQHAGTPRFRSPASHLAKTQIKAVSDGITIDIEEEKNVNSFLARALVGKAEVSHQDRFILPSITQVSYSFGPGKQILGYQIQPESMQETGGFLYLNDKSKGLIVFDQFGTYYKTLHYPDIRNFQVIEKDILFMRENKLFRYNSKTAMENEVLLPVHDSLLAARIEQQQLYLLTTASLNFYSF